MQEVIESMDEEERKKRLGATGSNDNFFIEFWNGSNIKIIPASECARGEKKSKHIVSRWH